jgi:Zn-dependent peptidase ImmA (M78 family)
MFALDLMELADCFTPEELVNNIFKQCPHIEPPVPVEEIARITGIIKILPLPVASENIEGILLSDKDKSRGVIFFNDKRPVGRQRFSIGHELGHFLIPSHSASVRECSSADLLQYDCREESEANDFAKKLLLPEHLLSHEIKDKVLDISLINQQSALFKMSFEATANTVVSLSSEAVAIVYIKDRTVRYNWRNFKFKFKLKVNKNDSLPSSYSIADLNPNSTLGFVELIVEDWLDLDPIINFKCTLYGQVFIQENGFAAILLKIRSLS